LFAKGSVGDIAKFWKFLKPDTLRVNHTHQAERMNGYYYTPQCSAVVNQAKNGEVVTQKMIALTDELDGSIELALKQHEGSWLITQATHFAMIGFPVKKDVEGRLLISE
jgi:hypothetical protein